MRTILRMKLGNLPGIPPTLDHVVIVLVPKGRSSQSRARELGQWAQKQTIDNEAGCVEKPKAEA